MQYTKFPYSLTYVQVYGCFLEEKKKKAQLERNKGNWTFWNSLEQSNYEN